MIHTFSAKKLLFTPVGFLNSVARWILGVHSPTGTIRISNTANPSDGCGPSIDVDCTAVAKELDSKLKANYPKVRETNLLGASLKWNGGMLDVDEDWVRNKVFDYEIEKDEETSTSSPGVLTMSASRNDIAASNFRSDTWASGIHTGTDGSVTNTSDGQGGYVKKGVKLQMITRVANAAGSLLIFFRTLEFDPNGLLKSVSAEDYTRGYQFDTY